MNTPIVPISIAADILSCRSPLRVRDARFIQNTIQVTNTTATIDRIPPNASCASKLIDAEVKWSNAPKPNDRRTATPTPAHSAGIRSRCPLRTMNDMRMLTTSAASSPSRRPVRNVCNTLFSGRSSLSCEARVAHPSATSKLGQPNNRDSADATLLSR